MTALVPRLPLMPERYRPAHLLRGLAAQGRDRRLAATHCAARLLRSSVPVATVEILDQLDITELIRDRVDLDALMTGIDVDAVVARADVDAIVARLDLIGLARYVAAGLSPPETGSPTTETRQEAGLRSIEADQAIAEWVERVFRPGRTPAADDPAADDPGAPTEQQ